MASLMPINGLPVLVSPLTPIKFRAPPSSVVSPSPAKRLRALMPEAQTKITKAYTKPGADDEALCTLKLELDVMLLKAQTNATPINSNIKRDVVNWVARGSRAHNTTIVGPRYHIEKPKELVFKAAAPTAVEAPSADPKKYKIKKMDLDPDWVRLSWPWQRGPAWPL